MSGERSAAEKREERRRAERRVKKGRKWQRETEQNNTMNFSEKVQLRGNKSNGQLLAIKTLESVKSLACTLGPLSRRNKGTQDTFTHRGTTRAFRLLRNQRHLFCRRHVCEESARIRRKKRIRLGCRVSFTLNQILQEEICTLDNSGMLTLCSGLTTQGHGFFFFLLFFLSFF